jgi:hypothetical protein
MNPDFDGCGHIPTAADSFTAHYLDMIAFGGWHTGRVARQVVERQRKGEGKSRRPEAAPDVLCKTLDCD